jgi:DNA-binding CsgD family transcriptional regulator
MPTSTVLTLGAGHHRVTYAEPSFLTRLMTEGSLCHSRHELAELAVEVAREFFRGLASAVMLVDGGGRVAVQALSGFARRDLRSGDRYECQQDPVVLAVLDRQVAVHSGQLGSPEATASAPIIDGFARSQGAFHYLAAPLYGGRGKIVAVLGVCRRAVRHPFDSCDIRWVTALAGHLSVALARLPHRAGETPGDCLTPREKQVAALVMQGANNVQIAASLQIARDTVKKTLQRMYEKLHVHGRAEMVAKLLAGSIPTTLDQASE